MRYSGRLAGLEDTVNVLELNSGKLIDKTIALPKKITMSNLPENQKGYLKYKQELEKSVIQFVKNNP